MSAVIDKGRWTRDCTCLECGTTFVYEDADVSLDGPFFVFFTECPNCQARCEVPEVSVKRTRELMAIYIDSTSIEPRDAHWDDGKVVIERATVAKKPAKKGSRK